MAQVTLPYTLTPGTPENVSNLMSNLTALRDGVNTIDTAQLAASSVTAAKLATDAVETAKIKDAAVTAAKLASGVGAGGLVYISSSSPSAASTISFDNVFTSSYKNYRVIVSLSTTTGSPQMRVRLRASASDDTNSSYAYGGILYDSHTSNAVGRVNSSGTTSWHIGDFGGFRSIAVIDLTNPQASTYTGFTCASCGLGTDGTGQAWNFGGGFKATTQFDGLTLYPASSSSTGFVAVYGYKES